MMDELREEAEYVILSVGDMIYDTRTRSRGFLQKRERRIDIIQDDIYIWTIIWFAQAKEFQYFNNPSFIEEDGLKISILLGTVILHSINGDNNE
jgi:hypothetical protein